MNEWMHGNEFYVPRRSLYFEIANTEHLLTALSVYLFWRAGKPTWDALALLYCFTAYWRYHYVVFKVPAVFVIMVFDAMNS